MSTLSPASITLETFTSLLAHYEETVKRVERDKAVAKYKSQKSKKNYSKTKTKAKPKAGLKQASSSSATKSKQGRDEEEEEEGKKIIEAQIQAFWGLDEWRYNVLPEIVRERRQQQRGGDNEGAEGVEAGTATGYLSKEEIVRLMGWKMYVSSLLPYTRKQRLPHGHIWGYMQ
ncbi:hypothetical protein BDW59DRAFT_114616 [Aspergillus cavernicola]|uniref:Uncharacterized protein n=1 Tax=Aspergillus cavernicola TaxID=176166 RepID=A0ABR4IW77_9EURO